MSIDTHVIPRKAVCPANGHSYSSVDRKTILHQVKKPWQRELPEQGYYFCDDPDCDVVYFGDDQRTLVRSDLRFEVGQKSHDKDKTICYCFDVRLSDLELDNTLQQSKSFVIEQTRHSTCDCGIRNPSGRCCLKDFPKE